ncbi:MAG: Uma2 family endonuclease [Myxococcales bacterium]|nr:Uma2 family endonuclease [Myxococcales bacterium]
MTEPARTPSFTFAEYLEQERTSDVKHEFVHGDVVAMAGGTPEHARLAARVGFALLAQLGGRACEVFSSDLRVRVPATGLTTYPDLSVVCGRLETDPEDASTAINPVVLVEVLSDGTEAYDRGEKFAHYRRLASLMEYVLVSQRERRIEVFRRGAGGGWTLFEAGPGERLALLALGCELRVDEIYASALAG